MKQLQGSLVGLRKNVPPQIQGEPPDNLGLSADAVDGLLHFAVTPIAAFDGIGRGRKQAIIQESQGLVDIGRAEGFEELAQVGKAVNPLA